MVNIPRDTRRRAIRGQGVAFDPESVELMTDAYLAACQILGLKEHLDDGMTRLVALRIISAAANGERDPDKLYEHGVRNFSSTSVTSSNPATTLETN